MNAHMSSLKADLHLHSTASDGTLTPADVVRLAAREGYTLIALTDHDSMDGVAEAMAEARACGVTLIPGVELSCGAQREIHILGYGMDPQDAALAAFCRARREQRIARTRRMVDLLAQHGAPVAFERVAELARGVMGRPHVARALVEAGHVTSVSEAFDRYIGTGKCAYVPKEDVRVADAVRLIHGAGGAAVLAHPMELKMGETALASLIGEWKSQGLDGIEVWHPSAQNNHAAFLHRLAREEGLLVTGGSDFHGQDLHGGRIGDGLERWREVQSDAQRLMERIPRGS